MLALLIALAMLFQTVETPAEFEVATVKPAKPGKPGVGFNIDGHRFSTFNTSLNDLIKFALNLHSRQIAGAPNWAASDYYEINAEAAGQEHVSDRQWRLMVENLLADRFKLTFHREKRELSIYAIVAGKTGPKFQVSQASGQVPTVGFRGPGYTTFKNATIADLAGSMQAFVLDRPVVDKTGLTARFDFELRWTPDETQFNGRAGKPTDDPNAPPDLMTAMQEQLGLKLESVKAPVDVFVIDHVERPDEN